MKISDYELCRSLADIKYYISLKMLESCIFTQGYSFFTGKKKKKKEIGSILNTF